MRVTPRRSHAEWFDGFDDRLLKANAQHLLVCRSWDLAQVNSAAIAPTSKSSWCDSLETAMFPMPSTPKRWAISSASVRNVIIRAAACDRTNAACESLLDAKRAKDLATSLRISTSDESESQQGKND